MFEKVDKKLVLIAVVLFLSIAIFDIFIIKSTKNVLDSRGKIVYFTNPLTYSITHQPEPLQESNWTFYIIFIFSGLLPILSLVWGEENTRVYLRNFMEVLADVPDNISDPLGIIKYDGKIKIKGRIVGWRRMYNYYLCKLKDELGEVSWICLYAMSDVGRNNKPAQVVDSYWDDDDVHQKYMFTHLHKEKNKQSVDKAINKIKEYDLKKLEDKKLEQLDEYEEEEED